MLDPTIFTKSGIMVGLGEDRQSVHQVMDDFARGGCGFFNDWAVFTAHAKASSVG